MNAEIGEVANRTEILSRRRLAEFIARTAANVFDELEDQHVLKELSQVVMRTRAGDEVPLELRQVAQDLHNTIVKVIHAASRANQTAVSGEVPTDEIGEVEDLDLKRKLERVHYPFDELASLQRKTG